MRKNAKTYEATPTVAEPFDSSVIEPTEPAAYDAIGELAQLTNLPAESATLLAGWLSSALARVPAPILCLSGYSAPELTNQITELLNAEPRLLPEALTEVPNDTPVLAYYAYSAIEPDARSWNLFAHLARQGTPVILGLTFPPDTIPLSFGSALPIYLPAHAAPFRDWQPDALRNALQEVAEYPVPADAELPAAELPNPNWVVWCALRSQAFGANPAQFLDTYKGSLHREFEAAAGKDPILQRVREASRQGDFVINPSNLAHELGRFHPNITARSVLVSLLRYAPAFAMQEYSVRYDGVRIHFARTEERVQSAYEQLLEQQWQLVQASLQADADRLQTAATIWSLAKRHGFPELELLGSRHIESGSGSYARYLCHASPEGYLALLQRLNELTSHEAGATGELAAPEPVMV